jgi:hypothetical protein
MPVSIGFLRRSAAAKFCKRRKRIDVGRTLAELNDAAHIHSTPDQAVSICLHRHNSATDSSPVFAE